MIFGIAAAAVVAAGCVIWLVRSGTFARSRDVDTAMRIAEPRTIADLAPNILVRVEGTACRRDALVTAPLSGRTCLYWALRISEFSRAYGAHTGIGDDRNQAFGDSDHVEFWIDDGTGKALVDPLGAEASLRFDHTTRDVPTKYATGLAPDRFYLCEEAIISDGEQIAIAGTAVETEWAAPADGDAYRSVPTRTWRFATNDVFKLAITGSTRR
jgi:hypothetical protein